MAKAFVAKGPLMAGAGSWSRDEILKFLESEVLRYQKIKLPFGLSTPGADRETTSELIFQHGVKNKSVLDVGCSLGYFCLKALQHGARRAVGWDVDPDCIRQARIIAEIVGLPAAYCQYDIEKDIPRETFDVVICLNVLHHLADPIAGLEKLLQLARERLVIEVASLGPRDRRKLGLSIWKSWLIGKSPVILVGNDATSHSDHKFIFTRAALENLLKAHRHEFPRIEVFTSTFKDRPLLIAQRRRIGHLVVIGGPTAAGKSTLLSQIAKGGVPELGARLAIDGLSESPAVAARSLADLPDLEARNVLLHYDFMRTFGRGTKTFDRDPVLQVLESVDAVSFVTVWSHPGRLVRQLSAEMDKARSMRVVRAIRTALLKLLGRELRDRLAHVPFAQQLEKMILGTPPERHKNLLRIYRQPAKVVELYRRWFEFCDQYSSKTREHIIAEFDGTWHLYSIAEWERRDAGSRENLA